MTISKEKEPLKQDKLLNKLEDRHIDIKDEPLSDFIPKKMTEEGKYKYPYTIPIFQRDFVWDLDKISLLFDSIYRGYTIGNLLLWVTNEKLAHKNVGDKDALPLDRIEDKEYTYVLDGQQRLTSLYSILRGKLVYRSGRKKPKSYKIYFDTKNDEFLKFNAKLEEFNNKTLKNIEKEGNLDGFRFIDLSLIFDDKEVSSTLRRLNNAVGHVQIKYETKRQKDFRKWLNEKFKYSEDDKIRNGLLEFHKISQDIYKVNGIIEGEEKESKLKIEKQYFHREPEYFEEISADLSEINDIINGIDFKFDEKQSYYNQRMKEGFLIRNWECEKRVIRELGLKCDFRREKTQVEVEFGNARAYYQDYIKFLLAYNRGIISLGVLIVPTLSFANLLCEIGKKQAIERRKLIGDYTIPIYSGMMNFEKAAREIKYLEFMLNMPISIMGVDCEVL